MTKKAFVTGANGFIGSFLVRYLAEQGIETTAFILKGTDCDFLKTIYPSLENITIIEGNILDKESLPSLITEMDYIVHLAGVVQGYTQNDFDCINVKGSENLLEACLKTKSSIKRIVLASSSAAAGTGTPEDPLTETKQPQPMATDFYGISKYRMELLAKKYQDTLPISIIRPCSVLGPGNRVIQDNYTLIKKGIKFHYIGPRREISVIDVEDLVHGVYLCLTEPKAEGETFFFCCDGSLTLEELQEVANYKIFNRKYGSLISIPIIKPMIVTVAILLESYNKMRKKPAPFINRQKVPAIYARGQVVSAEKAKKLLGWKPKHTIVSTITGRGKLVFGTRMDLNE